MKFLFKVNNSRNLTDIAILIARISIGLLMLVHGFPKMISLFSGDPIQFPSIMGFSPALSLTLAVFAEVLCSVLLIFGLGTRLAVIPLAFTMIIAVFVIHSNDPFGKQEMGLHYLLVYVVLFFTGSGRYSLDYIFNKNSSSASHPKISAINL